MTARILVSCGPGEVRVAVADQDVLQDYGIWRPGRPDGVGDLHRGRVLRAMPSLGGAFVAIEGGEGFLPGSPRIEAGASVTVRVVRAAQGEKGPRLALAPAPNLALALADVGSEGEVRLISRGPGRLAEILATWPDAPVEIDDAATLAAFRPQLEDRSRLVRAAFSMAIEGAVEGLAETDVALAGGVRFSIHPTPALVAIDVDFDGRSSSLFAANSGMLPALARHIRLRNLSGAILVDFAGLPARKRAALTPLLAAALAADPLAPRLLGFTQLGLAEIVRSRVHPPLHEVVAGPHAAGLVALRAMARQAGVEPAARLALRAAPNVAAALQSDPVALPDLANRTGRALVIRSDPVLAREAWVIERMA